MQGIYKSNINSDSWNFFANKKSRGAGKARQISEKQEITTFIREIPPTKNTLCFRNAPHPPTVPTVHAGNTPGPCKGKTPSRPAFRCPAARYPCPYGNVPRTPTRQLPVRGTPPHRKTGRRHGNDARNPTCAWCKVAKGDAKAAGRFACGCRPACAGGGKTFFHRHPNPLVLNYIRQLFKAAGFLIPQNRFFMSRTDIRGGKGCDGNEI